MDNTIHHGWSVEADQPDWEPLEKVFPLTLCGGFMWMHDVALEDGERLQVYKHSITRRSMHLAGDGTPYAYVGPSEYRRIRHHDNVQEVFPPWWLLEHATEDERMEIRDLLRAAAERDNADEDVPWPLCHR